MNYLFPWPPSILSPNNPAHYMKKAKVKAKLRLDTFSLAKSLPMPNLHEGDISVVITFCPPTKRHFDLDNLLSRCKGLLDGLADAWGVNDVRFRPVTIDIGDVIKGGSVYIHVSQGNDD